MARAHYTAETRIAAAVLLERKRREEAERLSTSVWEPQSKPQRAALDSEADETLFGGAAGGGKSDLLLGAAATRHYRSLILRREYPLLRDLIERTKEMFAEIPTAKYNEQLHLWKGLPGGRTIEFGSCVHEHNKNKYRGRPHGLKGFDELPQFSRSQFTFIIGWTRSTNPKERARVIGTGNPPMTPEEAWVIRYWAPWLWAHYKGERAKPGELRWFVTQNGEDTEVDPDYRATVGGIEIKPRSRTFLPARLQDNPLLMATGYGDVLNALPEPMRSLLLFGDYGDLSALKDDPWQVIPTAWVEAAMQRWRDGGPNAAIKAVAVDVATAGDRFVISVLRGSYYEELLVYPGTDTPDGVAGARKVVEALGLNPDGVGLHSYRDSFAASIPIHVDVIGPGSSVADVLRHNGFQVYPIHGSAASYRTDTTGYMKMANLRAEMHWAFREALDPTYGSGIALPDDSELAEELTAARWTPTARGVQVEDKRDIIKRLGRSPDKADAVMMAWLDMQSRAEIDVPTSVSGNAYGVGGTVHLPPNVHRVNAQHNAPAKSIQRLNEQFERHREQYASGVSHGKIPRPVRGPDGEILYEL